MSEKEKRSHARIPTHTMNDEQRKLIGNAIIERLIDPGSFTFTSPLATEGGDYNQNGGGYTQSGGGTHDQGGTGDYNQSSMTGPRLDQRELTNVLDVLTRIETLRR